MFIALFGVLVKFNICFARITETKEGEKLPKRNYFVFPILCQNGLDFIEVAREEVLLILEVGAVIFAEIKSGSEKFGIF